MKISICLLLLALVSSANAAGAPTYYPEAFIQKIAKASLKDEALKEEINNLLTTPHQKDSKGGRDSLGCTSTSATCYTQNVLGYDGARKILFGQIHLENENGKYFIKDVYCNKVFSGGGAGEVGPGAIPNHAKINCEHTWPQSKFSRQYPKEMQKSDLHHLYPTDSRANSTRGNYDFADVTYESGAMASDCTASKSGSSNDGGSSDDYFEPPTEHKGNVARALFYFSVRYKIRIPSNQEQYLKRWNDLDPVDDAERKRNEQVYEAQQNRNPFIDFPQLANYIEKF